MPGSQSLSTHQVWDLWFPDAGAQGLPFARGRLDAAGVLLVHAAPAVLNVDVRDGEGRLVARGHGLRRTADRPMARLWIADGQVRREDLWPVSEIGKPVILAGGEVGVLLSWWNADDGSEWRWRIELYNHR
ncbi:MAG TPA: hypothetical protein VFA70_10785 [Dehalococcoidia bacterium]|jgi:hypothetical protein|nr:hypothetical protein [Dehalococcoidia bacterium]